jgi:hypothetical protein
MLQEAESAEAAAERLIAYMRSLSLFILLNSMNLIKNPRIITNSYYLLCSKPNLSALSTNLISATVAVFFL